MNLTKPNFVTGTAGFICRKVCKFLLTKPALIPGDLTTEDSVTAHGVGIGNSELIEFSREFKELFKEKVFGEAKILFDSSILYA